MKEIYKNIFEITKEIELLIPIEDFEKIDTLLDKREVLIKQTSKDDLTIGEIKEIADKIKALDEKNIENMQLFKENTHKTLNSVVKNKNMISMYKMPSHVTSRFVDKKN